MGNMDRQYSRKKIYKIIQCFNFYMQFNITNNKIKLTDIFGIYCLTKKYEIESNKKDKLIFTN